MVVNEDGFFLSHRLGVALAARQEGFEVSIVTKDTGKKGTVEGYGLRFIDLPINKSGMNIFKELKTFRFLFALYRREKPTIVHHVGLKTMLWGTLASRLAGVKWSVNAVSGLGYLFIDRDKTFICRLLLLVFRMLHSAPERVCVIFQNRDDRDLFLKNKIVRTSQVYMTNGSGVDLKAVTYSPEPSAGKIRVLLAARMLKDKGIMEYIAATQALKSEYEETVEFLLCGGLDSNPNGISGEYLGSVCDGSYLQWLGYCTDVPSMLRASHIAVLPSYREGTPRFLIEAAATGRPIVTTDAVGCRETVREGYNGFLVPIRDSEALVARLKSLIDDPIMRQEMGINSRRYAEERFSIEDVIGTHLEIYRLVMNDE
jgi:glycosyltransferase involved in cell wall biosynthesis